MIVEWLERTAESPNEKVRISSIFMLAAKYIQMEKYKEANIFLDKIPDTVIDGTCLLYTSTSMSILSKTTLSFNGKIRRI